MARDPSTAAEAKLDTALGTEPLIVIEIDWNGGTTQKYADQDYLTADGKIISLSVVTSKATLDGNRVVNDVTVVLDDTDGSIKDFLDSDYLHKSPARVYQTFVGLLDTQKFLLFDGEVNLPLRWNEGTRQVEFEISSPIESAEVGFSPEQESSFDWLIESSIGKMWPLAFGSALRVNAVKVIEAARGRCLEAFSLISVDELRQLANAAYSLGVASYEKDVADGQMANPWVTFSQSAYTDILIAYSNAHLSVMNTIESLVRQNVAQRDNLHSYADAAETRRRYEIWADMLTNNINSLASDLYDSLASEMSAVQKAYDTENAKTYKDTLRLAYLQSVYDDLQEVADGVSLMLALYAAALITANAQIATSTALMTTLETTIIGAMATTIQIDNKGRVADGVTTDVILNNMHLVGTFSGNTFTITESSIPTYQNLSLGPRLNAYENMLWLDSSVYHIKDMFCLIRVDNIMRVIKITGQTGTACTFAPVLWGLSGTNGSLNLYDPALPGTDSTDLLVEVSPVYLDRWSSLLDDAQPDYVTGLTNIVSIDWEVKPGDTAYFTTDTSEVYVVNDMATTSVHEVMAYRTVDGEEELQPVPSSYYTVDLSDTVGGRTCTTITMIRPLSSYLDEGWRDDIYVSMISTIGSNTADVIENIITTWTDYTVDSTSFAAVEALVTKYPMHFAVTSKRDAMSLIQDIAMQARCAAILKNGVVYLKYMSTAGTPVLTLDESTVMRDSLVVTSISPDSIETVTKALWKYDGVDEGNEVVIRNGVDVYGLTEKSWDYWCYNIEQLVQKSATFWHIRRSNTWKILNLKTTQAAIRLEALDVVTVDFTNEYLASSSVDCLVLESIYDAGSGTVDLVLLCPVLIGQLTEHAFFWSADASSAEAYPSSQDVNAGDGYVTWELYPSDTGDPTLADPIAGRAQQDYVIYVEPQGGIAVGGTTKSYEGTSHTRQRTYNKTDGRSDNFDIELTKTNVVDTVSGGTATFGQIFKMISEQLHLDISTLNFYDPVTEHAAGYPLMYDGTADVMRGAHFFPVTVAKDGGAAGDVSTQCSWTYGITCAITGTYLVGGRTPGAGRTTYGAYAQAPDASVGIAYYLAHDDGPYLLWCAEQPVIAACP